jgi:DNA-binding NarL/FixJ family response regulator
VGSGRLYCGSLTSTYQAIATLTSITPLPPPYQGRSRQRFTKRPPPRWQKLFARELPWCVLPPGEPARYCCASPTTGGRPAVPALYRRWAPLRGNKDWGLHARREKVQLFPFVMPFDVLLVDDHKIMRDGIKAILNRSSEFRVVGEAENGTDAVQFVRKCRPQIVLMDIGLPGLNGVETTAEILRHQPECKVVILSMYDDEHSVVSAVRSGARAFILKRASDNDLLEALRMVAAGGMYLSPQVSDRLLTRIQKGDLEARQTPKVLEALSPREVQVLRLVADGKTSKEIAVLLDLREQTVRSYRKTMMKKLGVNNVAGLTQLALSTGLTQAAHGSPR